MKKKKKEERKMMIIRKTEKREVMRNEKWEMIRRVGWRGIEKNRVEEYSSVAVCCLKIRFTQRNSKELHM